MLLAMLPSEHVVHCEGMVRVQESQAARGLHRCLLGRDVDYEVVFLRRRMWR